MSSADNFTVELNEQLLIDKKIWRLGYKEYFNGLRDFFFELCLSEIIAKYE